MNKVMPQGSEKYWVTYIKQRIKRKKNFIVFISCPKGSGKSWSSLRICQELDPDFSIDQVVFKAVDLMELINSGKLKKGSCILFEEAGIEMNNRNWQSTVNKMLNYLMQTFRHKNFILIMNSPYLDFVDAGTRKLFHAEMMTIGIDRKKGLVKLKPQLIQYNSRKQRFYYKFLKILLDGEYRKILTWGVCKPTKDLINLYEIKKKEFTTNLNKTIYSELNESKKEEYLTQIQQETLYYIKDGKNVDDISKLRSRDKRSIQQTMQSLKKKGFIFKPILIDSKILRYEVVVTDDV